jgi:hypothetical protein
MASFAANVFIFIKTQKLIAFVAVIQMSVLHRMACSILKTFFDLSSYLAENTVFRNNSYWIPTSFVATTTAVQLAHTKISDKEILDAKLRRAERVEGRPSVGRHATMLAFDVRVTVCVVVRSQVSDSVVKLTAWHRNAGA